MFEHADGPRPRRELGYCTDDNARLLLVMSRADPGKEAAALSRVALEFVLDSQDADGLIRNRMNTGGWWTDAASIDDCWGRAVWGLGTAAVHHGDPAIRTRARKAFDTSVRQRSPWSRALSFAALGAIEVIEQDPAAEEARDLLRDVADALRPTARASWYWPEARLTYANAALAEALIGAGAALNAPGDLRRGLDMLEWLIDLQTREGHLSVVGVGGRHRCTAVEPQFDQQPIEVAALADACWRAWRCTGNPQWVRGIELAGAWFRGLNDIGVTMCEAESGAGYDGLTPQGPNLNQGAESTLAFVSTMQRVAATRTSSSRP